MKIFFYFIFYSILAIIFPVKSLSQGEIDGERLFDLSLEELMNVVVKTGNITGLSLSRTPVSVTTITAADIAVTPVRNLYDLIEVYVPGAIYLHHYDSPHLGVRGLIVDRNYKFLLLVNGRNMNLKAHNGATSELEMWDLNDIEKVEIIRGPGSVTYGPGAVAGIINITTKNPMSDSGVEVNANYVYPYRSEGVSIGINKKIGNSHLYVYGSVQKTNGYSNPKTYAPIGNNVFNLIGSDTTSNMVPIDYYYDYNGLPQLKFYSELTFWDSWSLSLRYTRQGASLNPNFGKQYSQIGFDSLGNIITGNPVSLIQNQDQHITFNLKNETSFGGLFNLSSLLSLSSEYYIRRTEWFRMFNKNDAPSWDTLMMLQDVNSLWNHRYDFSESSALGRFIFNKDFSDKFKVAAGTEFSFNFWGPGWGKNRNNFRLGDNYDIISGPDSYVYGSKFLDGVPEGTGYYVGGGWSTFTYSYLFELMWEPVSDFSMLVSARTDKDTYSPWLFSPRLAFIFDLQNNNILKLVIQQSKRMNTAAQLLIQHLNEKTTDPESLTGIELIYSGITSNNLLLNYSLFYNNLEVISWYNIGRSSRLTGNLSLYGMELEGNYTLNGFEIGINQSFVKQIKWELADSVYFSGISYSDYFLQINDLNFRSSGNDLNNWANFVTKLFVNYKLFDNKLILHLDSRIYWGFEGENAGKKSFENAMNQENSEYKNMVEILKVVNEIDMYGIDFRVNFSATYEINRNLKISALGMNLFGYGNNKRYYYDSGIRKDVNLLRHGFIEEPLTLALKLEVNY